MKKLRDGFVYWPIYDVFVLLPAHEEGPTRTVKRTSGYFCWKKEWEVTQHLMRCGDEYNWFDMDKIYWK